LEDQFKESHPKERAGWRADPEAYARLLGTFSVKRFETFLLTSPEGRRATARSARVVPFREITAIYGTPRIFLFLGEWDRVRSELDARYKVERKKVGKSGDEAPVYDMESLEDVEFLLPLLANLIREFREAIDDGFKDCIVVVNT
jgi:hypothetical protein